MFFESPTFFLMLLPIIIWEAVWKGIALWKSGRNSQLAWFVCIFIFNTLGILPIVYILFFQKRRQKRRDTKKVKKY